MRELTPDNFKDLTKEGYWFIKHYSPACTHCRKIAPAWQTLYEFYYVSWGVFLSSLGRLVVSNRLPDIGSAIIVID